MVSKIVNKRVLTLFKKSTSMQDEWNEGLFSLHQNRTYIISVIVYAHNPGNIVAYLKFNGF